MSGTEAGNYPPAGRVPLSPLRDNRPGARLRLRLRIVLVGAALVVLAAAAVALWMTWDARRLTWDRAVQSAAALVATQAHDIERTAESYDLSLQAVMLRLNLPETSAAGPEPRREILFDRAASVAPFGSIRVLDETGRVTIDSRNREPPTATFAERDYFRAAKDGAVGLFVSAPFRGRRDNGWRIALSRRLEPPGTGRFAGVVAGTLRLDYFQRQLASLELGRNGVMTLLRTDGTVVMRQPSDEREIGRDLRAAAVFHHFPGAQSGAFEDFSASAPLLVTYRQIGELPLILMLEQSSADILADWRRKAAMTALVVCGLLAVATLLGALLRAELSRRSEIERELAQNNAALSAILRQMPDGILVFDRDNRMVAWNDQAFSLTDLDGTERDQILAAPHPGRAFRLTLARRGDYGPGDPDELVAGREATARAGRPTHFRRQSASGRWIDVRGVPTADGGWLGTYRDVTEEVAREYELRDASERLEEQAATLCATAEDLARARMVAERASQSKSQFLANMSHELRTPLNGVIGFADLMEQQGFGPLGHPRYLEYTRDIGASGRHLLELINDILDFTKADAGKLELQEDDVDVVEAAAAALRMVRTRAEAAELTLELRDELTHGVVGVRGDERRLKQIVLNLVANAIKFTPPPGRVTVTVGEDRAHGGITIAVSDTGIGISADDLPRVMEAFSQVDHGLNRRHNGSGLGLPLTKHLAELHGGALAIESTPGAGTTVTVRLPEARVLRLKERAALPVG